MKLIFSIFIFFFMIKTHAQDLSSHQWQDRVLLVISDDTSNVIFKKQLAELSQNREELKDRKLVIYQITPDAFRRGLENNGWEIGNNFYKKYNIPQVSFRVILLGLDGGDKLNKTEFLPAQDLFVIIDGMPMRKAEIRKKGK